MPKTTVRLSAQEIQAKLEKLAKMDDVVIFQSTVKELRSLSAGVVDRKSPKTGKDKTKSELYFDILEAIKPTRERLEQERQLELSRKDAEALSLLAATKTPTAEAIRETHQEKFQAVSPEKHAKDILEKLTAIISDLKTDNNAKLIKIGVLAQHFVTDLLNRKKVTSVRSDLSDIREQLKIQLPEYANSLHYENLTEAVEQFKQGLSLTFEPYQTAYNIERKAKVVQAANNQVAIDGQALLAKATDVLTKIADGLEVDAINTAIALGVVTGRRLSEVFGTRTEMIAVDYNTVSFKGQLKARNDALKVDTAFNIPTLVDSSLVVTALAHLRSLKEKDGSSYCLQDPEDIKLKHGKRVSRAIAKYEWNSVYSDLTFKTLRDIYAVMCLARKPEGISHNAYIGSILGHDPNQLETASVYQKFYLV